MKKLPQIWTVEEVLKLEKWQHSLERHPYTCFCLHILSATPRGWYCENCDEIVQTWAHAKDLK